LCEVCRSGVRDRVLASAQVLGECGECGHLTRDLTRAPAAHRDLAYGGEPTLDRARLTLTYRTMTRRIRPGSVFEVGYGDGSMLRRFHDDGARTSGADPDQLHVDVDPVVARVADLFQGPVEDAPTDRAPVDLVYGVHVLEHVRDPIATLEIGRRMLRPGGMAQFFTPAGDSDGLRLYADAWWMLEDPTHIRFFTAASLANAAERAGFVDVQVRRPMLDSLTTDVASAVRRWRPAPRPEGVLGERRVLAAGLATAPAVLVARCVRPTMRPTLQLVARNPR